MTNDQPNLSRGVRHRTMAEMVADQLHEEILAGTIPMGSHLRLNELAARLGTSPMPVREAVRRLESLGLVEQHPHRGAFVRGLSMEDFRDTSRVRVMLERTAVEWAAARFDDEQAERASKLLERYRELQAADRRVEAREVHADFHFALYRASGSPWLLRAIEPVWRNSERYRFATDGAPALDQLVSEHEAIIEACRARKPAEAGAALAAHLEQAAQRMEDNVRAHEEGGESG